LGEARIAVEGIRTGRRLGLLANKTSDNEVELLVYNYNETDDDLSISDSVSIFVTGLSAVEFSVEEYSLDRENNNTYRAWQQLGSPKTSSEADLQALSGAAELSVTKSYKKTGVDSELELQLLLPRHSMLLIKLKGQ